MKNFTKILFTFLLVIASNQILKAQDEGVYYEGTINGNLKIQMYLEHIGEQGSGGGSSFYEGWYYYESQGKANKLSLEGMYSHSLFYITEEYNEQVTGSFELRFDGEGGYQGTWTDASGNKSFPVVLKMK